MTKQERDYNYGCCSWPPPRPIMMKGSTHIDSHSVGSNDDEVKGCFPFLKRRKPFPRDTILGTGLGERDKDAKLTPSSSISTNDTSAAQILSATKTRESRNVIAFFKVAPVLPRANTEQKSKQTSRAPNDVMWIHGNSLVVQEKTGRVANVGSAAFLYPSKSSKQNWVHFAVPTPTWSLGRPLVCFGVHVVFFTRKAAIIGINVWDGATKLFDAGPMNLTPTGVFEGSWPFTNFIKFGLGISVAVRFDGDDPDSQVGFVGAGMELNVLNL